MNKKIKDAIGLHWSNLMPFLAFAFLVIVIWFMYGMIQDLKDDLEQAKVNREFNQKTHQMYMKNDKEKDELIESFDNGGLHDIILSDSITK